MASETGLQFALDAIRGLQSDLSVFSAAAPRTDKESVTPSHYSSPTVFISWAHAHVTWTARETRSWQESLATLASTLRQRFGIDADIDLFHLDETVDWTRFGQRAIVNNQKVIIVLSKAWAERWDGSNDPAEGAGAAREADALHGLYSRDQKSWQDKLVIVLLPGVTTADLPPDLDRVARIELDPSNPDSYEPLIRNLTGQPTYEKPALGTIPVLPPLNSERNLAALRAQLAAVRVRQKDAAKDKTNVGRFALANLELQESALRGFIETALQGDE